MCRHVHVPPCALAVSPDRLPGEVPLELTVNGQDFTTNRVIWRQYVQPSLSSLHPPAGPAVGSTLIRIRGLRLHVSSLAITPTYRCGFGKLSDATADDAAAAADAVELRFV